MNAPRSRALLAAAMINAAVATIFWLVWLLGSRTFFDFWNRPLLVHVALTLLFVLIGARVSLWYTRKINAYALLRLRGPVRILPLAFGTAICSVVVCWLAITFAGESTYRIWRHLFYAQRIDFSFAFAPLLFFVQFLFSPSTVVWLLAAGVIWPLSARLPTTRRELLRWYGEDEDSTLRSTSLSFVRLWNVAGYLLLLLSLMYQSQ